MNERYVIVRRFKVLKAIDTTAKSFYKMANLEYSNIQQPPAIKALFSEILWIIAHQSKLQPGRGKTKDVTEASGNWQDMGKVMRYSSKTKFAHDNKEIQCLATICGRTNKH